MIDLNKAAKLFRPLTRPRILSGWKNNKKWKDLYCLNHRLDFKNLPMWEGERLQTEALCISRTALRIGCLFIRAIVKTTSWRRVKLSIIYDRHQKHIQSAMNKLSMLKLSQNKDLSPECSAMKSTSSCKKEKWMCR